ncbi:MAG: 2-phosphosulfolactate phosphatase [Ignavibacteriales bacterium]|nr:2-phosphosulfolactate phosphatase [Ignavibacteriales bacterium]MCF8315025.1 2-phosphosulfolactate phosphatase [Ignavibacteriales bacterium]MCF8435979.1 2-phosphosulfolactate phosphatase [Ignavibacteriales bacterium]
MNIKVLFSPLNADELFFSGKNTVVIDVLRSTTTIITALDNGAKEVLPVNSIEFAMKISVSAFGSLSLIAGERNGIKIDGFNLGNSPLEFDEERVKGKSIILYTTNGTKAMVRAKFSSKLYVCSFTNLSAVARKVAEDNEDLIILTSGSNGMFCLEDTVCAGMLIDEISALTGKTFYSDSVIASCNLSAAYKGDLLKLLKECEHGKTLIEKNFMQDMEFCSRINSSETVPVLVSGAIRKLLPENNLQDELVEI